ncbi:hypothetical protein ACOME3_001569 [Neoechinorhynchus agilis]
MSVQRLFFIDFVQLCDKISSAGTKQKPKSASVEEFVNEHSLRQMFEDLYIVLRFLLPQAADPINSSRKYQLDNRQLLKHFAEILECNVNEMFDHLNGVSGDASLTIEYFWTKKSTTTKTGKLTCVNVDCLLEDLSTNSSTNEHQLKALKKIYVRCTRSEELRTIVRLIKKDMRYGAGAKVILDGLNAYNAYQQCKSLKVVAERLCSNHHKKLGRQISAKIDVMSPVAPMLAQPCRSVENAMNFDSTTDNLYAETKYDGERVQVHQQNGHYAFYSRSLKAVQEHKVSAFRELLTTAFPPSVAEVILDCEVLLYDTKTKKPLPFGTLGRRKAQEAKTASKTVNPCLFVFDCLFYNGKTLINTSLQERRRVLESYMVEQDGRIMLSRQVKVTDSSHLKNLIDNAIADGLEGLVLKRANSYYEPGKRNWLKVKKDYLADGSMADSADLVVLGAYYGTGSKAGMKSVFLMGCYNEDTEQWCTVTKVGNGFTDDDLDQLQTQIRMDKLNDKGKLPHWLNCKRMYVPDFIVENPRRSLVLEVSGAEFSTSKQHTANGISIRFPRVTRIRDDKSWLEATSLKYLTQMFEKSKTNTRSKLTLTKIPDLFMGKRFEIDAQLSANEQLELERKIVAYGGCVVQPRNQMPNEDDTIYVVRKNAPNSENRKRYLAIDELLNHIHSSKKINL